MPPAYNLYNFYLETSPEIFECMPDKENASNPVVEKEKTNSMAKSVQDHVDLAQWTGDQLHGVHQGDGIAGVGAGHPATDSMESCHQ